MARPNPLDLTVCPTPDVMAFPLAIVTKLTENLYSLFEAVRGPGTIQGRSQSAGKMYEKVAAGAL
jgi:hypothetical protein